MSPRRALSTLAILGVISLAASGCAAEATEGPSAPPSSSATPTPTETAEAAVRTPLTELILTTEGLGELTFGAPPPTGSPETNLVAFNPTECAAETPASPGLWTSTYDDINEGGGPVAPFAIGLNGPNISRIDVHTTQILTDQGLGVGSSLDAVLGSYPGGPDEVVNHADVTDVYVFNGTKGKLMFEVAVDRLAGYWDAGMLDTVIFLSAIDMATPSYGVAATDNAIGVCGMA